MKQVEMIVCGTEGNWSIYLVRKVLRCFDNGLIESPVMPLQESRDIQELVSSLRREWGS